MRHLKGVKQLGRLQSHRKAMFANMLTSLFTHERIVTTKQKGRELIRFSDRLISRAKGCVDLPEQDAKKVHNKRIVLKTIRKREAKGKKDKKEKKEKDKDKVKDKAKGKDKDE